MTPREIVFAGAGGLAREALVASRHHPPAGFVDDDPDLFGTSIADLRVLGTIDHVAHMECLIVVCTGAGPSRRAIVRRLDALGVTSDRYATIVHPTADVPWSCSVGAGTIVLAGVSLTTDVVVGHHVVLMPQCVLTHDVRVGDFATLAAGVTLGGNVTVGEGAYLGMNSSVRENVTIGADAILGMGSVALEDIPPGQTWVGSPARPLRTGRFDAGRTDSGRFDARRTDSGREESR